MTLTSLPDPGGSIPLNETSGGLTQTASVQTKFSSYSQVVHHRNPRKNADTIDTRITTARMMQQQNNRPQHLPRPPFVNAPLCSSERHSLSPSFFGIAPSAAICACAGQGRCHSGGSCDRRSTLQWPRRETDLRGDASPRDWIQALLVSKIIVAVWWICILPPATWNSLILTSKRGIVVRGGAVSVVSA